jgi:hypothetical protein
MEKVRIFTIDDLYYYKETLDKQLKEVLSNFNHTIIKDAPNPWGWSPLADIQIFMKPHVIYTVQILHCGSVSCLNDELRQLIQSWLNTVGNEETRIQQRNDLIRTELAFSVFQKENRFEKLTLTYSNK